MPKRKIKGILPKLKRGQSVKQAIDQAVKRGDIVVVRDKRGVGREQTAEVDGEISLGGDGSYSGELEEY